MAVTGKLMELAGIVRRYVSDPTIKRMAHQISRQGVGFSGDDIADLRRIYSWVQGNIQYVPDPPFRDVFVDPVTVMNTRQDDCDGMSVLIATFGKALGFRVKLRAVGRELGIFDHVYPILDNPRGSGSGWMALDAIPGRVFGQEPVGFNYEDWEI